MQLIGLYYPYIHFRSEEWLKAAALYWPRMARVVPDGFVPADAGVALALKDELDFVIDVSPREAIEAVSPMFKEVFSTNCQNLIWQRYADRLLERGVRQPGSQPMILDDGYQHRPWPPRASEPGLGPELVPVHSGESESSGAFGNMGLYQYGITDQRDADGNQAHWVAMDPALAWIWKRVLVDELARRTGFVPATDQLTAHPQGGGTWGSERLAVTLLGKDGARRTLEELRRRRLHREAPATPSTVFGQQQYVSSVGHLAVRCVVPRGLGDIPVEKIIQLRTRHAAEFDAFANAVASTATELRDTLGSIEDQTALQQYLRLLVHQRFTTPLKDLESAMKGLKMEAGYTAIGYKIELGTAAAASLGGVAYGSSLVTAGALAFGVASVRRHIVDARDAHLRNSAIAYLLRLKYDLEPQSLLRRILRVSARATGTGV
ncbi:DUF6236 family protein [Streptomyces sp. NPDC046984]|uniref:DUF6236 family protein n=1 Tax=Streptomyces sp. NPDC046984 TaxID=3155138 RepID=UPI0034029B23